MHLTVNGVDRPVTFVASGRASVVVNISASPAPASSGQAPPVPSGASAGSSDEPSPERDDRCGDDNGEDSRRGTASSDRSEEGAAGAGSGGGNPMAPAPVHKPTASLKRRRARYSNEEKKCC